MNKSASASHFFAQLRRETAKFYVLWYDEREDQTQFSFCELRYGLRIQPQKKFINIWQLNDVEQ